MGGIWDLETPCFVYREDELRDNLAAFRAAAEENWPYGSVELGISVKTAPIAGVISYARECGYSAEVVSDEEYLLALSAGFPDDEIVFNGPVKGREMLERALRGGATVNLDSNREVRWVKELAADGLRPAVGLRVNFDLEAACPGESSAKGEPARFGFCFEDGSLAHAVEELRESGVEPIGLHGHFSTETHSVGVYRAICSAICEMAATLGLRSLRYIDVGGGFYGGGGNRAVYSDYAQCIAEGLAPIAGDEPLRLILEPGGSVLATAGTLLGRVIDVKTVRGSVFAVSELSKLSLNSTLFSRRGFTHALHTAEDREKLDRQTVCGFTCMEMDRILDLDSEERLAEGDIVEVHNAGAYAASFTPRFFIKDPPKVYMHLTDGSFEPIPYWGERR